MWWCSCFKPSTSVDPFEAEFDIALEVSRHEADVQEAAQVALVMEESSREEEEERRRTREREEERRRTRVIEEERRRTRVIEEDAQIANGFLYDDRERQKNYNSALEDEQLAKALAKSLKENGKRKLFEEQVKKDEQLALIVQESLNMENEKDISRRAPPLDVDEQLAKAIKESLKVKGKEKQFEDEQVKKDEQLAAIVQESLNMVENHKSIPRSAPLDVDEQLAKAIKESLKVKGKGKQFEDEQVKKDEQLAAIVQESLNMVDSPVDEDEQLDKIIRESLKGKGQIKQPKDEVEDDEKLLKVDPPRSMCGGCNSEIEHGRSVDVLGVPWHPECLWCDACHKPIAIHEVENHISNSRGNFHKSCYNRYCYVCKEKIRMFNQHHFWKENYCPAHDSDKTPMCCSCERLQPRGTNFVMLGDSRQLCLECMDSAVMDTYEVQPLHFEIREYFEGLNMKIEKEFPFLLVEKQALNEAEKEEKIDNQYELVTRGICLSEAQTVTSVSKGPRLGPNKQLTGMATESQRVVRECEVTAILILYGLPRLLTGYILAHEMMHAYLRLNGHRILNNVLEEGICQVLGHMWLESQTYAAIDAAASSSASSSRTPLAAASASKKGECSDFEKKLVEFYKNQIEKDDSPIYGVGFNKVYEMVSNSSLQETLQEIIRRG